MPETRHRGSWWPLLGIGIVLGVYAALAGLEWWIQVDAHGLGARARQEFGGDEVGALLSLVQSDGHSLGERDRAVHALGQIGDRRALPVLEALHTGRPCDHSRFLCQYELRKAIDRCSGRNWPPRWLPFFPRPPRADGST